jgi:processive 1,2-diacylglycerol beta-glucosyltransferase
MNILLLHASAGAGHRRAAEALAAAFHAAGPGDTVITRDILDFTPALFRKTYAEGYLRMVRRAPELWSYLYAKSDRKAQTPWRRQVRAAFNKINAAHFLAYCDEVQPDLIVCTHFLPLELLSTRRSRHRDRALFAGVVTDFAVHALWIFPNVPAYYVATEEGKRHMTRCGCPSARIHVTGIPVAPEFMQSEAAPAARARLGLDPALPTVLVLSGGYGVGPTAELIAAFKDDAPACQLLVVAGASAALKRRAEAAAASLRRPVKVFGFVNNMNQLMDAADLVISKPGGLTTAELLAKGKPLLVVEPIPGQEQRNAEYLLEAGAGARLYDSADAPFRVAEILNTPGRLAGMQERARACGRPHAALDIVEDLRRRVLSRRKDGVDLPLERP